MIKFSIWDQLQYQNQIWVLCLEHHHIIVWNDTYCQMFHWEVKYLCTRMDEFLFYDKHCRGNNLSKIRVFHHNDIIVSSSLHMFKTCLRNEDKIITYSIKSDLNTCILSIWTALNHMSNRNGLQYLWTALLSPRRILWAAIRLCRSLKKAKCKKYGYVLNYRAHCWSGLKS